MEGVGLGGIDCGNTGGMVVSYSRCNVGGWFVYRNSMNIWIL